MSSDLAALSKIEQRLANIETVDDAKTLAKEAELVRRYAKTVLKNLRAQNQAALIRVLAQRGAGGIFRNADREQGKRNDLTLRHDATKLAQLLKHAELDGKTGYRWMLLASEMTEAEIRQRAAESTDASAEFTSQSLYLEITRRLQQQANKATLDEQIDSQITGIYHGDFRQLYQSVLVPESAQLVLTDPPYDKDGTVLFEATAQAADHILRPGGSLLVYMGKKYIAEAITDMRKHLRYWWTFAIVEEGPSKLLERLGVRSQWRPVLWFVKGTRGDTSSIVLDIVDGRGREKSSHEWQQAEGEAAHFIEQFTNPGDLVVDFFAGSGTVLAAAKALDRRWVGFEERAHHVEKIIQRLS